MTDCEFEHDDGSYVLGALSTEERAAFERHLPGCPSCSRSVRELAGLPGLLARIPIEILDPEQLPVPVPDTLLPALVRRARRTQRRRAWITGGLVAAAAVVAIGAVGVSTLGDDDAGNLGTQPSSGPSTADPLPLQPVGAEPISGWVSLTQVGWGTRLDLTCSYADEDDAGDAYQHESADGEYVYSMYVTRSDGSTEQVASWQALPGRTMHLAAATAADTDDVVQVTVRSSTGETVLELDA